jgi:hypothetical protein
MYLQKVISKKTLKKTYFSLATCQPLTKKAGSGSGAESVSQWYRSEDPDLDPVIAGTHAKIGKPTRAGMPVTA